MHRLLRLTLMAALVPSLLACAALPGAAGDSSADDNARILAGIEPRADSPLAGLTREAGWRQHARGFGAAWESLEERQLSKIRIWSAKNITRPQQTMLYMFSGPDFLYADVFFPEATTYVLSGLEPVGSIPDLSRLRRGSLSGALAHIRSSLGSVMNYSFFITKHMRSQLRSGEFTGTLPLLYVLSVGPILWLQLHGVIPEFLFPAINVFLAPNRWLSSFWPRDQNASGSLPFTARILRPPRRRHD